MSNGRRALSSLPRTLAETSRYCVCSMLRMSVILLLLIHKHPQLSKVLALIDALFALLLTYYYLCLTWEYWAPFVAGLPSTEYKMFF